MNFYYCRFWIDFHKYQKSVLEDVIFSFRTREEKKKTIRKICCPERRNFVMQITFHAKMPFKALNSIQSWKM